MKLQAKLALFNAVSKMAVLLLFIVSLPLLINYIALINTDEWLTRKKDQVLNIIHKEGIDNFIAAGNNYRYGSYNLLKEEFISLEQIRPDESVNGLDNSRRDIEGEIFDYRVLSYTFSSSGKTYLLEVARSVNSIGEIGNPLRKFALYLLVTLVLLTMLIDITYMKLLFRPLNKIIHKLKSIKYPYFNPPRIKTSTADFQYLDDTIHNMMHQIEEDFNREREFISNVSHELLTPVSIIQTKLENLLMDEQIQEAHQTRIADSLKTLSRLKNVVKTLLLISKIENCQYIKDTSVSIRELAEEVKEALEDRAAAKNISFKINLQHSHIYQNGNKELLFMLLFNLANNGIKYNKEGGELEIRDAFEKDHYILEIKDTGIGIAPENLPYIFNRFKRYSTSSEAESYGLGLPIVRTVAEFHHIHIHVNSELNEGSSFKLIMT